MMMAKPDVDRFKYGYDYASNRTYRDIDSTIYGTNDKDQAYLYDGLHRLTNYKQGTLSGSSITSMPPTAEQTWSLDALGNWKTFVVKASGTTTLDQARTVNKANEITQFDTTTGNDWRDPTYDAAGKAPATAARRAPSTPCGSGDGYSFSSRQSQKIPLQCKEMGKRIECRIMPQLQIARQFPRFFVRFVARLTPRGWSEVSKGSPRERQDWSIEQSICSARDGSLGAVGNLLDHFRDYLLMVANAELASDLVPKVAASDLVQETCFQATRDFRLFDGETESALRAWLRQILLNNVRDAERRYLAAEKRDLGREVPLHLLPEIGAEGGAEASVEPSPSAVLMGEEKRRAVENAIRKLPQECQRVIDLRNFERWTFEQIGREIGKSTEAVRKIWARAVRILQRELSNDGSSDG